MKSFLNPPWIILFVIIFTGCLGPASNMNNLTLGMTQDEVIRVMGQPGNTRAQGNVQYYIYSLYPWDGTGAHEYFVRFVKGKVDSYGRQGDFDSTKIPERKLDIDLGIKK